MRIDSILLNRNSLYIPVIFDKRAPRIVSQARRRTCTQHVLKVHSNMNSNTTLKNEKTQCNSGWVDKVTPFCFKWMIAHSFHLFSIFITLIPTSIQRNVQMMLDQAVSCNPSHQRCTYFGCHQTTISYKSNIFAKKSSKPKVEMWLKLKKLVYTYKQLM